MTALRRPLAFVAVAGALSLPWAAPVASAATEASVPAGVGLDLAGIDSSVAPGTDFFAYANGTWLKTTPIPPDRATYGVAAVVAERTGQRTRELIEQAAGAHAPAGSDTRKIGDYYTSFMDEAGIEAKGLAPLQPELDRIQAIRDRRALARFLGSTLRADVDVLNATNLYTDNLFGLWIAQDLDEPSRYVPFILQGGLDMPDRAYYLDPSPRMAEIRAKCQAHVARMLALAHVSDAEARAARIFEFEHKIAEAHGTREDTADVQKGNNHWTRKQFDTAAPGLDWQEYFAASGLGRQQDFVVWQPGAVTGLSALVASQPLDTWKDYLVFHAIEHRAGLLPKAFGDEAFAFHGTELSGTPARRERWKRAVDATSIALGEAVGRLYVERYFPPAAKARVEGMVRNILAAFGRRIDKLGWMAPATKAQAKAKLAALKVGVGYPDRWVDYSGLQVVAGDAFGNSERAEMFELHRNLDKLGRTVDRSEWVMTPQTVNAVNLPAMNAMNFPAAILQPPYFDPDRPLAMDYGAIGATIGHEISHSFDDQGAQFDATGRLRNWWTPDDLAHFQASGAKLVQQYDAYKPFPDLAVNGKLTLSENIADVAGLAAAYDAYTLSRGGKPAPVVEGLTGDQQFFLSFAQSWRAKFREPALRAQVLEDGHAPDEYRADTVRNLDVWYDAFAVTPSQALYLAPGDRVRVW
jgi:predicted metalloendopeptidase